MVRDVLKRSDATAAGSNGTPTTDLTASGRKAAAPRERDPQIDDLPPTTPYEVVHQSGLLRLRHYRPAAGGSPAPPILLVYSLIKRPYILDLLKERSVVGSLLHAGYSVYLTDWLPPGPSDADRGLQAYVDQDLAGAVDCICSRERTDRVTLIGPCFGGLLAVIYAALYPTTVQHLVPLATPFRMRPMLLPGAIQYLVNLYGNVPAWFIRGTLNASSPSRMNLSVYMAQDFGQEGEGTDESDALTTECALEHWMKSDVPVAGRLFREIMEDAYQHAQLAEGRLRVGGRRVALERIECPLLNVAGERDQLAPPGNTGGLVDAVGSREASNLVFPVGHIGLMVSRAAHERLWPRICAWLRSTGP